MKINIIGDIAGRYDELLLLLAKMPEADLVLSVGDMVDRGPKSRQVIEFFMNTPNTEALYGNHEDMMVDALVNGRSGDWMYNGGGMTLKSYVDESGEALVPAEHVEWLQKRPLYFKTEGLFVSHAPITSLKRVPRDPYGRDYFFVWDRWVPKKPMARFVVCGHNGTLKEYKWGNGKVIGMCIDNSHHGELVGMHWPTKEIFRQEFIPVPPPILSEEEKAKLEKEREEFERISRCFF